MDNLLLACQWILFPAHPLTKEEYYFAMASGLRGGATSAMDWELCLATEEDMSHLVSASSKGLAVLTALNMTINTARTVQFTHESVRDFLLKEGGLDDLSASLRTAWLFTAMIDSGNAVTTSSALPSMPRCLNLTCPFLPMRVKTCFIMQRTVQCAYEQTNFLEVSLSSLGSALTTDSHALHSFAILRT